MCLEIKVNAIIDEGVKLNGKFINKTYTNSCVHLFLPDEAKESIYELVIRKEKGFVALKTNKQIRIAVKKGDLILHKLTNNGFRLMNSISAYGGYYFSFYDDHLDPFQIEAEKITINQLEFVPL